MTTLTEDFYKVMPKHCNIRVIQKEFKIAINKHLKKFKWAVEYKKLNAKTIMGDFHNIIGYKDVKHCVNTKFKTLLSAYKYSQTLENAGWIEIRKNGKKGGTVVLPGGFVVWTEKACTPFVDEVDIESNLFKMNKHKHPNSEDYALKILETWWKVTPKVFKQYYPKLDFKKTMKKEFGKLYF